MCKSLLTSASKGCCSGCRSCAVVIDEPHVRKRRATRGFCARNFQAIVRKIGSLPGFSVPAARNNDKIASSCLFGGQFAFRIGFYP